MDGVCNDLESPAWIVAVLCSQKSAPWCLPYKLDQNVLLEGSGRDVAADPVTPALYSIEQLHSRILSNKRKTLLLFFVRANNA